MCVHTSYLVYPFICWWTLGLPLSLGNCEQLLLWTWVCKGLWGPVFHPFGYISRGGIAPFFEEPSDCLPQGSHHFTFPISHILAHTCHFVFTVAIFMAVRSAIFKILRSHKKWTQKPSSSFLPFVLYFFPSSLPARLLTSTTSVGQPGQPPHKGTTHHLSFSGRPCQVGTGLLFYQWENWC